MAAYGGDGVGVPPPVAILASIAMTIFYVAILYSPTLILRLPPPSSFKTFMIRRFICAGISTVVSLLVCAFILPVKRWNISYLLSAYGIRLHHTWEAVVLPLCLTSLMYTGSFILKVISIWSSWAENGEHQIHMSFHGLKSGLQNLFNWMLSAVYNISVWRMYIVAPLTEELVFRACMISLLLCGGSKPYTVILLSPVLFSLAHLNHLLEFYMQQNSSLMKASMVVGKGLQSADHICRHLQEKRWTKCLQSARRRWFVFFLYKTSSKSQTHHNFTLIIIIIVHSDGYLILCRCFFIGGFQLGYTVIFGSYASFLFVRTGHIAAPLVSHMFCNIMGLPTFFSRRTWLASVGFVAGAISFVYLLFPLTSPTLYNDRTDHCKCWHTYCYWT